MNGEVQENIDSIRYHIERIADQIAGSGAEYRTVEGDYEINKYSEKGYRVINSWLRDDDEYTAGYTVVALMIKMAR